MGENCNSQKQECLKALSKDFLSIMPLFKKKLVREDHVNKENYLSVYKINHSQFHVLGILNENGKLPISEIGRKLFISTPNMTKLLAGLIEEDYIVRLPDEKDRRIINIDLTDKGRQILNEAFNRFIENVANAFATLPDEQLEKLSTSLATLREVLSTLTSQD